jgi:hypothetical protein
MDKQEFQIRAMEYLCGEMSEDERIEFEIEVEKSPDLKAELEQLSVSRSLLQQIPRPKASESDARESSRIQDTNRHTVTGIEKSRSGYVRAFIVSLAALFLATILAFTFVQFEAGQSEHGFYIHFGERTSDPVPAINENDLIYLLDQIREENRMLMAAMIEQNQQVQNAQLQEALNLLTDYYERQRQRDLIFITEGLIQLEENTHQRFQQTDEVLVDLLHTLSNQ